MEQELASQIRAGDERAFEQVFRAHYSALCGHANKILKDLEEAEEVVQDSFCKIWERREQLEITDSLKAYLFRTVHNACLNHLKHRKVRLAYAEHAGANQATYTNHDSAEQSELESQVLDAMNALPEKCREVFELSRFDGLKYREIAAKLNISEKTVENQMGKAFKILRDKLGAYLKGALLWMFFSFFN